MTKRKPKPDPLAKVSAPNLRRMVKRLQADERRLTRVCQSHHERYLQTLARVMELEDQLAEALINQVPLDPNDHPHPCGALEGERYALTPQVTHASEPMPQVETKAGPTWVGVTTKVAASDPDPAPQAGAVVVHVDDSLSMGEWDHDLRDEAEPQCWGEWRFNSGEPTTLPAMPAMTLAPSEVFNPRVAWSWLYWDWRRSPLTCPAVRDSLNGRKALLEDDAFVVWPSGFGCEASMWLAPPSLADICVPPATWRAA